jgi:hypothetical protein
MSFDLRIQMLGLAMYVPEGDSRMHVVLPRHGKTLTPDGMETIRGGVVPYEHDGHHGNGAAPDAPCPDPGTTPVVAPVAPPHEHTDTDRHFPRLMYDIAYEKPNQTRLSRTYRLFDLEGRVLDLSGLPADESIEVKLTSELPAMDAVAGPVPRAVVEEMPGNRIAGRVTMESGALTRCALGASFHLNDPSRASRMAWDTEWTIRGVSSIISDDRGDLPYLQQLLVRGPLEHERSWIPTLFPIGQTIQLIVFNAVRSAFPPHGESFHMERPTGSASHFAAYYSVCPPNPGISSIVPSPADSLPIGVEGDVPEPGDDHQLPGAICVQVQASLAPPV